MRKVFFILCCSSLALFTSCSSHRSQPTVVKLDTKKYAGQWHEIGRLPNRFEADFVAARATYIAQKDGSLSVLNEGLNANGKRSSATGRATQPFAKSPGELKVRFDKFPANLFTGDYWVLGMSEDYTRALIGSPNQHGLWLLSKREKSTKDNFVDFVKVAKNLGYSTESIIWNPKRITTKVKAE